MLQADAKTNRFRDGVLKKGGTWRDIYGIDEKKVASMVREDEVDILVELTGHTANNKLGMMACRPAPVQVSLRKEKGKKNLILMLDHVFSNFFLRQRIQHQWVYLIKD